MRLGKKG